MLGFVLPFQSSNPEVPIRSCVGMRARKFFRLFEYAKSRKFHSNTTLAQQTRRTYFLADAEVRTKPNIETRGFAESPPYRPTPTSVLVVIPHTFPEKNVCHLLVASFLPTHSLCLSRKETTHPKGWEECQRRLNSRHGTQGTNHRDRRRRRKRKRSRPGPPGPPPGMTMPESYASRRR